MTPKTDNRRDLLAEAWVGDQIIVDGKILCMAPGKHEKLRLMQNKMFCKTNPRNQTERLAMGEIVFVCCNALMEIQEYWKLSEHDKSHFIADYMIQIENDYDNAEQGILARVAAINASMPESEAVGKSQPEQDLVSSLVSLSSQFQAD